MRFSLRDLIWSTTTIAMLLAMVVMSHQNASRIHSLNERIAGAEMQSARYRQEVDRVVRDYESYVDEANQIRENERQEILSLRQLLKESLGDQRNWFELQVKGNRIIAIGPATSESVQVTPHIVDLAERRTGLDGRRLRHFLTPIEQLRLVP